MHFYPNEYTNMFSWLLKAYSGLDYVCVNAGNGRVEKLHMDLFKYLSTIIS